MADCKKCGSKIGFVFKESIGKWVPTEYDSIDYDNDEKDDSGNIIWNIDTHIGHKCVGFKSGYRDRSTPPPPPKQNQGQTQRTPHAVLWVATGAPKEVIQAAYRALAKLHHPDLSGGDTRKMQEINAAWEKLK